MSFTIRAADIDDAGALADLRVALFEEIGRQSALDAAAFRHESFAAFERQIASGICLAWLAESDDEARKAIGSVAMLIFPRLPSPESFAPREGYLLSVYTVPEWRRRGVSSALLNAAIAAARALGLSRIRLHATAAGQPIYAAAGFRGRDDEMEIGL